jgi:SPP1 family predicted phage head-tail adaptor
MISSELVYRITLQKPVQVNDEFGSKQNITWEDAIVDIWAGIKFIGGNTRIQNYELFTSQIVQFNIRYRDDFDSSYRIVCKGKYYQIMNVDPYAARKENTVITANLLQ